MRTQLRERDERKFAVLHAKEATSCYENNHAINQLSRHRRQHAPVLKSEGIRGMDRLNRSRAKQSNIDIIHFSYSIKNEVETTK
jgi:hypothetical protein